MGYGSRALHALNSFYSGEYFNLDESVAPEKNYPDHVAIDSVSIPMFNSNSCAIQCLVSRHVPNCPLISKSVAVKLTTLI